MFGPYSCADSSQDEDFRSVNPGYPAYSKGNCMLAARQRQAVAWLNCSLIYYPLVPGTRYCSPMETTYLFINKRQYTENIYNPDFVMEQKIFF
jgi:hypothetical protein